MNVTSLNISTENLYFFNLKGDTDIIHLKLNHLTVHHCPILFLLICLLHDEKKLLPETGINGYCTDYFISLSKIHQ